MGRAELVLHVRPLEGLMRRLDGTVEKRFAKKDILYPLQVRRMLLSNDHSPCNTQNGGALDSHQ